MSPSQYTRIILHERPIGQFAPSTFKADVLPFNLNPGNGQILVQVLYLSMDPGMWTMLDDRQNLMPAPPIGGAMSGPAIGVVVNAGRDSKFARGDIIQVIIGWVEYAVVDDKDMTKLVRVPGVNIMDYLGNLGHIGFTAYFGLLHMGHLKAGETLVVSAAAGATGSAVCQIGKLKGARVVAIAGSAEKIAWLKNELGVDEAINYKSPTFHADFDKAVGRLDVYFDNVGGEILDYALTRMNRNARVVLCGQMSEYNAEKPTGLKNTMHIIAQCARLEGFFVSAFAERFPEAFKDLATWAEDGSLKSRFQVIIEGLHNAPHAFALLFAGGNIGKLVVKVSDLPKL